VGMRGWSQSVIAAPGGRLIEAEQYHLLHFYRGKHIINFGRLLLTYQTLGKGHWVTFLFTEESSSLTDNRIFFLKGECIDKTSMLLAKMTGLISCRE